MDYELIKARSAIIAAVIAAITSIITLIISSAIKHFTDKNFHDFKLQIEYRYDQQKKIKEQLSRNKMQFLNLAESLCYRIKNFNENVNEGWMDVKGKYTNPQNTYFVSTVYRMAVFFAWIKKIEKDMIYLDVTLATKEDLYFVKYLKLLQLIFCDHSLFDGYKYDKNYARDHFFRNNFEKMVESLIIDDKICDFTYYEENLIDLSMNLNGLCLFLDGINPYENRYRWDVLQLFELTLIAFLNSYGYDFQYTNKKEISQLISHNRIGLFYQNYLNVLSKMKMDKQKELRKVINIAKRCKGNSNNNILSFEEAASE